MKRKNSRILICIGVWMILFLMTSCIAKTYYLRSEDNGFSDAKISDTTYTVTVKSKNAKEKKRLQDIFYLRAAEIARDNGYPFFYTVETVEALAESSPNAKPFKQITYSLALYQIITISGVVKLLKEKPTDSPFSVHSSEFAYQQREYLIIEKERVLGENGDTSSQTSTEQEITNDISESQ